MLTTELYLHDIPDVYRRFAHAIGAEHWHGRVALCNAEIAGNEQLREHLESENEVAFQLAHLGKLLDRFGRRIPVNALENPGIHPAVSFMAQILSLLSIYPPAEAEKLTRRVHGAFKKPDDMRGLRLELTAATHFTLRGKKVSWPEVDGIGTFDLLVEDIGVDGLEIECKAISNNKGRKIHAREAIEFQSLVTSMGLKGVVGSSGSSIMEQSWASRRSAAALGSSPPTSAASVAVSRRDCIS